MADERQQQQQRRKKATPASVYLVIGLIYIVGGSVVLWAYSGVRPATVESNTWQVVGCVFVILGVAWFYRPLQRLWTQLKRVRERRRWARRGLCVKCGYNLKGLSHLRCPECGHQNVPYEEYDEYALLEDNAGE
jgi:hypothetical protein